MNSEIERQIALLREYQTRAVQFPAKIAEARAHYGDLEATVHQAKQNLEAVKATVADETLMDPARFASLTSEVKRKAAVEADLAKSPLVSEATANLQRLQRELVRAQNKIDEVRDQRRACEYAQTAAIAILNGHQIKGEIHDARTRSQPERYGAF